MHYLILPDTATPLLDYLPINLDAFNPVVIPPLSLSADVPVRSSEIGERRENERFKVVIVIVGNGRIGDGTGVGTIVDDDVAHLTTNDRER